MAPLLRLVALFALFSAVLASPHIARHLFNHAHRAVAHPNIAIDARVESLPNPRRKRSLNKRCIPRPSNTTSSALPTTSSLPATSPSSTPATTAPINVAPMPSLPNSSSSSAASPTSTPPQAPSNTPSPTTPSTTPAQTSPASSSSGSSQPGYLTGTQFGQATFYDPGLGACGITNSASDNIVAVSHLLFDSFPGYDGVNPNTNPVCGKTVTASYQGKSVTVTITDRCEACAITDLDLSPNAFDTLAAASVGRINMDWVWN